MLDAVCVQPWRTTTSGWFAGRFAGTYSYIESAPGFDPNEETAVSVACAADDTPKVARRTRERAKRMAAPIARTMPGAQTPNYANARGRSSTMLGRANRLRSFGCLLYT